MPKTFGGLLAFAALAVVTTLVGMAIISRVGFLRNIAAQTQKAA